MEKMKIIIVTQFKIRDLRFGSTHMGIPILC